MIFAPLKKSGLTLGILLSAALAGETGAQESSSTGFRAFGVEAVGGTIGSVSGAALGLALARIDRCDPEALTCTLTGLAAGGIGGTVGATIGAVVAGRMQDTEPSVVGAMVGAVAGAFGGVGLIHLMTEEANLRLRRPGTLVVFSMTQGILTALGSRLLAGARR